MKLASIEIFILIKSFICRSVIPATTTRQTMSLTFFAILIINEILSRATLDVGTVRSYERLFSLCMTLLSLFYYNKGSPKLSTAKRKTLLLSTKPEELSIRRICAGFGFDRRLTIIASSPSPDSVLEGTKELGLLLRCGRSRQPPLIRYSALTPVPFTRLPRGGG